MGMAGCRSFSGRFRWGGGGFRGWPHRGCRGNRQPDRHSNFDGYPEVSYSESAEATFRDGFDLTSFVNLKDTRCRIGGFRQPFLHDYLRIRVEQRSVLFGHRCWRPSHPVRG